MLKVIVGILLGLLIGAACRWFDIPVPGPPKLTGAMLVVAMTVGYLVTDKLIAARFSAKGPASTQRDVRRANGGRDFLASFLEGSSDSPLQHAAARAAV